MKRLGEWTVWFLYGLWVVSSRIWDKLTGWHHRRIWDKLESLNYETGFLYYDRSHLKDLALEARDMAHEVEQDTYEIEHDLGSIWAELHDLRSEIIQLENGMIQALQGVYLVNPEETKIVLETLREAGLERLVQEAEFRLEETEAMPVFLAEHAIETEAHSEVESWQLDLEQERAAASWEEAR